jgi:hypothetical protein
MEHLSDDYFREMASRISAVKKDIECLCILAGYYSEGHHLEEDPKVIHRNILEELADLRRIFRDRREESKGRCYVHRCRICTTWLGDYDITKSPVVASGPCPGWWTVDDRGKLDYRGFSLPEHVQLCEHNQIQIIKI